MPKMPLKAVLDVVEINSNTLAHVFTGKGHSCTAFSE